MVIRRVISVEEGTKYRILLVYASIIFLSAFFFNTPSEIILGMKNIIVSPSILLTDYIKVGNLGAAFFNSGSLMLIALLITRLNKVAISGPIIAGIFTIGGFAFFGKNIYNVWGIIIGVYMYALTQENSFDKFIIIAFFGTALAPVVSQVSFGFGFDSIIGIVLGNLLGIISGFLLTPLANHFIKFHQGYNLYNVGFTAGIIGTLLMSLFRLFGFNTTPESILSSGNNKVLAIYFMVLFFTMFILGLYLNNRSFKGYKNLLTFSGRLTSDFLHLSGLGLSLINMGLLGILAVLYVFLVKGDFNGPVIGALLTVVGFGAFGKHIKNTVFIVIGVYVASMFTSLEPNSTTVIITALFGTCLAPIAGKFGWQYGIVAGIIHLSIVMNTAYLHGGTNLYNNGFSAGIVAAILIPVLNAFIKESDVGMKSG